MNGNKYYYCDRCGKTLYAYDEVLEAQNVLYCEDCANFMAIRDVVAYEIYGDYIRADDTQMTTLCFIHDDAKDED